MRPKTLREVVERARTTERDVRLHGDELLDNFYRCADAALRHSMIRDEPGLLDDPFHDALIGAVGEHLARRWGLRVPEWTENARRFLDSEFFYPDLPGHRRWLRAVTPPAFARRGIRTGPEPLHRLNFPGPMRRVEPIADENWPDGGIVVPPAYRDAETRSAATRRERRVRTRSATR